MPWEMAILILGGRQRTAMDRLDPHCKTAAKAGGFDSLPAHRGNRSAATGLNCELIAFC